MSLVFETYLPDGRLVEIEAEVTTDGWIFDPIVVEDVRMSIAIKENSEWRVMEKEELKKYWDSLEDLVLDKFYALSEEGKRSASY